MDSLIGTIIFAVISTIVSASILKILKKYESEYIYTSSSNHNDLREHNNDKEAQQLKKDLRDFYNY